MERTVGFDDFTMGVVHRLPQKFKMPSGYAIFAIWKQILDIFTDKKLGQTKWNVMMEKLLL